MDANIDFNVIQDEIHLYLLGIISEDELIEILNQKRREYGLAGDLKEIPNNLKRTMKLTSNVLETIFEQFE